MAPAPSHSLGAFPKWCALLYKSRCPAVGETEADGLLMNPLQAVTYTRLPGTLPQPSHGLLWPGKVRPVHGVHGKMDQNPLNFHGMKQCWVRQCRGLQAPAGCGCFPLFRLSSGFSHLGAPQGGVATILGQQGRIHCAAASALLLL